MTKDNDTTKRADDKQLNKQTQLKAPFCWTTIQAYITRHQTIVSYIIRQKYDCFIMLFVLCGAIRLDYYCGGAQGCHAGSKGCWLIPTQLRLVERAQPDADGHNVSRRANNHFVRHQRRIETTHGLVGSQTTDGLLKTIITKDIPIYIYVCATR